MAKTILQFPDGRTQEVLVLCAYNKDGNDVLMFDTETKDGPHKVTGVAIKDIESGLYQNVVDPDKWHAIKADLVNIIHDKMDVSNYRVVEPKVNCSIDAKRDLGLRQSNYDAITNNYNKWLASMQVANEVNQAMKEQPNNNSSDLVSVMDIDLNNVTPQTTLNQMPPIMPQTPGTMNQIPDVAPVVQDMTQLGAQNLAYQQQPQNTLPNDFAQHLQTDLNPGINQQPIYDTNNVVPFINPLEDLDATLNEDVDVSVSSVSAGSNDLAEQMRQVQNNYLEEIKTLNDKYMKEMLELLEEEKRNIEEAKAKNSLAQDTLVKYQSMVGQQGTIQPQMVNPQPGFVQNQGVALNRAV